MKYLLPLCLFLFTQCSQNKPIEVSSIRVSAFNPHPFFKEHSRVLIVVDEKGNTLDQAGLFHDIGDGCDAYLFDTLESFILIDCNGYWYSINKKSGRLTNEGWKWHEELPDVLVGRFLNRDNDGIYVLLPETSTTPDRVYRHKDPG